MKNKNVSYPNTMYDVPSSNNFELLKPRSMMLKRKGFHSMSMASRLLVLVLL